jgi:hypothetical protein
MGYGMKNAFMFLLVTMVSVSCLAGKMWPQAMQDPIVLNPQKINQLFALDAMHSTNYWSQPGIGTKRLWYNDCPHAVYPIIWNVSAPQAGNYYVTILIYTSAPNVPLLLSVSGEDRVVTLTEKDWQRFEVAVPVSLPAGNSQISIKRASAGEEYLKLKSIELVNVNEKANIDNRVAAFKGDTSWMKTAGYGIMVQAGGWCYPPEGDKKPWPGFAEDFDPNSFVQKIDEMGAGFLLWSATWMDYLFPAPIEAIAEVMPSRVSERDLIGELIAECQKRNIRFMLYYHMGHHIPECLAVKGWVNNAQTYASRQEWFELEKRIFEEVGERYGTGLDGYFIDDGCVWYPADFEAVGAALKAGNPDRVICYNPSVGPSVTPFQDFYAGEGVYVSHAPSAWGTNDGVILNGPHKGLQYWGCFRFDSDWGVYQPNTVITDPPSGWNVDQIVNWTGELETNRFSLAINMSVYEDGSFNQAAYRMLHEAAVIMGRATRGPEHAPEFTEDPIIEMAMAGRALNLNTSLADKAIDLNYDLLTFSKISGPAWLTVSPEGYLTGTPTSSDIGINEFIVEVNDGMGFTDQATLQIEVTDSWDGSIGDWPLDEDQGTIAEDISSNQNNGTLSGANWIPGVRGAALDFSGSTTASISVGDLSSSAYTWSMWAYFPSYITASTSTLGLLQYGSSGTQTVVALGTYSVLATNETLTIGGDNDGRTYIRDTITSGWHHLVFSWDTSSNYYRIYIDRVQKITYGGSYGHTALALVSNLIYGDTVNFSGFNGYLDELKIYGISLTGQEIADLYDSYFEPENNPPVFTRDPIIEVSANENIPYTGNTIADDASDPDAGDVLTFSKIEGPAWLTVAPDGTLSGTPSASDTGLNTWTVEVTDGNSEPVWALLEIAVTMSGDITGNGKVNLEDFAFLASYWLQNCVDDPDCDKANLDNLNGIDLGDLMILVENWL